MPFFCFAAVTFYETYKDDVGEGIQDIGHHADEEQRAQG